MKQTDWKNFFDEDYYTYFQSVDNSAKEAKFIIKFLDLKKEDHILDIGCGNGRHLLKLHKAGFRNLTGVDFSENFVEFVQKHVEEKGLLGMNVEHADFLQHDLKKSFDKAYSFFSSFGYFSDERNEEYIKKVAEILNPGGLFLLDIFNYFYFVKNYQEMIEVDKGDMHFVNKNKFDVELSINEAENVITDKETGRKKEYSYVMRYYTVSEIKNMLAKQGFEIVSILGDYEGQKINTQSKRAIFVCRKS